MRIARSPIVVGRDEELAAIGSALHEPPRRGACVFLLGEAGSGKTRLLREARSQGEARDLVCLSGGSPSLVRPPAFGVLAEGLRSWTRSHLVPEAELAPFAAGLRQVLPELPMPSGAPELTPDQLRLLAVEGAFRLLAHAGGRNGALLLLDDLQDADPETLTFVHHAASAAQSEPVVVIGAVRVPEGTDVAAAARTLEDRGLAVTLELGGLSAADVGRLLRVILDAPPPPELVADLLERTGGVPLLVEQLLETNLEMGTLEVRSGSARWSGRGVVPVPGTVLEVVRRKLSRIPPAAARVLSVAAVVGRTEPELLASVTGTTAGEVAEGLREGIEIGLLDAGPPAVAFRHALVREAIEQTLLDWERREMHRAAADAMAELYPAEAAWLEERSQHLEAAGSEQEAAILLLEVGRRGLAAQTPASAEAALRRVPSLTIDPALAAAARDGLAEATGMQGRWEEALGLDVELLEMIGETPERLERMARHAASAGRLDEAEDYLLRARAAGAEPGRLDALAALVLLWRGRLEKAASRAESAIAEAPADPRVVCPALDVLGRARAAQGRSAEATAAFRRWIRTAGEAGLTALELQGLMELGVHEFLEGEPDDHLREARDLAGRYGVFSTLVLADLCLLWWCGRRARVGEAVAFGEEAVELCRRLSLDLLPHALMAIGWARGLEACGSGEDEVAEALSLAPGDVDLEILAGWMRGEWELRSGRYDGAAELLGRTTRLMHASPSSVPPPAPFLWLCALVGGGRRDEARAALPEVRSSPALSRQYVNRLWLAVGEALLVRSPDRLESAVGAFEESSRMDIAVAYELGAEVLGGDVAHRWLRAALETFERGGMETDAARTRQLLRVAGAPVPRPRRRGAHLPERLREAGVTEREAEVLALVARGLSNRRIAEEMYLSPRTVQSHVSSLLAKLGAENRAALIAAGLGVKEKP